MRISLSMVVVVAAMLAAGLSTLCVSKAAADPQPNAAETPTPAAPSAKQTAPAPGQDQASHPTRPDDAQQILKLLDRNDLAGAEKLYFAALKRDANDSEIRALAYKLFVAQARARQPAQALDYLLDYLDFQIDRAAEEPEIAARLPGYWNLTKRFGAESERSADVIRALERAEQRLRQLDSQNPHAALHQAAAQALSNRVLLLAQGGQTEQALELSSASLKSAQRDWEQHPENLRAVLATVWALQLQAQVAEALQRPDFPDQEAAFLKFLDQQLAKHPLDQGLQEAYLASRFQRISRLVSTDPKHAEELRLELIDQLQGWEQEDGATKTRVTSAIRSLEGLKLQLERAIKHQALVGQAIPDLQVESWLNGSPLTAKDLQGKVVLLDFWAVWCGPCIATFPHLREWHEKFADRGLIIIGLTRNYGYGWNEATQSPQRVPEITPEAQVAALEQFVKFHQLDYRIGVMPMGATTSAEFGVSGIPQVVLVDGEGKIRMIRVGSGEQNSKDIEAMMEQLLPKPATSAAN